MADVLDDLIERYEYGKREWETIRKEAATDMQYVSGNPWTADDEKQRKNRPTVAPEEMGQYFNQVINNLWANPRGGKFTPRGNGASEVGARFYQNKWREIEYRSHAKVAYTTAASDAIQRSYGFIGITAKYASSRSANQELWIEAKPDPDLITIDPEALSPDSSDMQWAFEEEWREQNEFKRKYKQATIVNFGEWSSRLPSWISGNKVKVARYWAVTTRKRTLVLVQPPTPAQPEQTRVIAPTPVQAPMPVEVFDDEIPAGATVIRSLREVDYPQVRWYLTNGLELLDQGEWRGKYIPIVSCYGKMLYVPTGGESKRVLLSMTRFGRAPWKALCYAASQQLEVISMIPKAPFMVPRGTFPGELGTKVQESMHIPKAYLEYEPQPNGVGDKNPPPQHVDYPAGEHIQALEIVKEGWRRAIQSAMGSNFLPTQAQRRNEKSGVALEKMEQAASTGTFHFVNNYEDMIRQAAVIGEDLIPYYYDFPGQTGVMEADLTAKSVWINSPEKSDAIPTEAIKADYLVTVSTGPSSDSEREAVQDLADTLAQNLEQIASVSGPKVAAYVLSKTIRFRNGGPEMDQLADAIEPPEFKQQDGQKPPDPQLIALQGENQQLQQQIQQLLQERQAKIEATQAQMQGKFQIAQMQEAAETQRAAADREVKLAVAELGAKMDRLALFMEERARLGLQQHDVGMAVAEAGHEARMADMAHQQNVEMAQHQAVLAPSAPNNGAGA